MWVFLVLSGSFLGDGGFIWGDGRWIGVFGKVLR